MATQTLTKASGSMPSVFDDFFKPWNAWFDNRIMSWGPKLTVPAVNIEETNKEYQVSLAAPGMKKDEFKINVDPCLLTIEALPLSAGLLIW